MRVLFCLVIIISGGFHSVYSDTLNLLDSLRNDVSGLFSSFSGNFALVSASGQLSTGKIYYQYPNKMKLTFSSGGNIITDGRFLWLYNSSNLICAKQDVAGSSGGIFSLLEDYNHQKEGARYVFTNEHNKIYKIIITVSGGMFKNIKLIRETGETSISFSNIVIRKGMRRTLFYFKDVNAQVIENPLNN